MLNQNCLNGIYTLFFYSDKNLHEIFVWHPSQSQLKRYSRSSNTFLVLPLNTSATTKVHLKILHHIEKNLSHF